jgi:hypothetical protein
MMYSCIPGFVGTSIEAITQIPTFIVTVLHVFAPLFGVLIVTVRV